MPKSLILNHVTPDFVYTADTASLSFVGDCAFEIWLKLDQLPSVLGATMQLFSKYKDTATVASSYMFRLLSNDTLQLSFDADGDETAITNELSDAAAIVAADVGVWTYFAVTVDVSAPSAILYKGDEGTVPAVIASTTTDTAGTSIADTTADFMIGAQRDNADPQVPLDGKIFYPRVWNDIRTAGELQTNYKSILTGSEGGLVASYLFNDDLLDQTSNDNDLTDGGSSAFSFDTPLFKPQAVVF